MSTKGKTDAQAEVRRAVRETKRRTTGEAKAIEQERSAAKATVLAARMSTMVLKISEWTVALA